MIETFAASRGDSREQSAHGVSIGEAFRVWLRVAALSFGGPAGQIAVMHRILVEEKRWVSETRFMHALNYCMLLLLAGALGGLLATWVTFTPCFLWIFVGVWSGLASPSRLSSSGPVFVLP